MSIKHILLRRLHNGPYFRGRDRIISAIAEAKPVRLADGLIMELDASEWVQFEILTKGATEPDTLGLITKLVNEGDVVIDVGAHVGHHAMVAARECGGSGRVLAIDPQPYNADRTARNAINNGFAQVQVLCAAVGDCDGFVSAQLQNRSDRARLSLALPGPNDLGTPIEVPIRRLDTIFAAHTVERAKLIKIDVEGFELEVLHGLGRRLVDCENLIVEILDDTLAHKKDTFFSLLREAGFTFRDVSGAVWQPGAPLIDGNLWASKRAADIGKSRDR